MTAETTACRFSRMTRGPIRVLELSGSPRERGRQHAEAHRDEILTYAEERVRLVGEGRWSKRPLERAEVLSLAEQCLPAHEAYSPDLMEEVRGMADVTGLSMAELIIVNGFTDFVDTVYAKTGVQVVGEDDCTAFIIPDAMAGGAGFQAQTWDMHDTATDHVVLLDVRPDDGPRQLVFTTTGCVGQMGMNEAGICVGINNLPGADGDLGVTWVFAVRKALEATNFDDALEAITSANLAGAHSYLLRDAEGRGAVVEGFSTVTHVTEMGDEPLVHTNHALHDVTVAVSQDKPTELQASSSARYDTAAANITDGMTVEAVEDLLSHPTICYLGKPPFHVETCGAAIMRPGTGEMWACWGQPSEEEFTRFELGTARV